MENNDINYKLDEVDDISKTHLYDEINLYRATVYTNFILNFILYKPPYNLPNELVLDNTGFYYVYDADKTLVNGESINLSIGVKGTFMVLRALNGNKTLQINLSDTLTEINNYSLDYKCLDTPYGFKLSDVINNLGTDLNDIKINFKDGDGQGDANLSLIQTGFSVKGDGEKTVTFNFTIENNGSEVARKVLFKDILPNSVSLNLAGIYINSVYPNSRDVKLNSKSLFVRVPDISVGESVTLTIVCRLNDESCNEFNVGVISYVSKVVPDGTGAQASNITIKQIVSNSKEIQ